jgi:hypothetical protein
MEVSMGVRQAISHVRERLVGRDPMNIRAAVTDLVYVGKPPYEHSMSLTATHIPFV